MNIVSNKTDNATIPAYTRSPTKNTTATPAPITIYTGVQLLFSLLSSESGGLLNSTSIEYLVVPE